jgi:beta-galactosidase GanA
VPRSDVRSERIITGASYYPLLHDDADWERDVRLMREHGLSVVRTAELMNSWDRIEIEEGQFRFEFVDRFLEILQHHQMQALLGDGAACPPAWLALRHPETRILSRDGIPHDFQGRWGWACYSNPEYLSALDRYQTTLVERYRGHPALFGWQVHNEVGLPARMRFGYTAPDVYCYCEHCKRYYREWLRRKYATLDALNDAWRWDPTNVVFTRWDDVEPVRAMPHPEWGAVTKWLDWRSFWKDHVTEFVGARAEFIRRLDPEHPISTNIFILHAVDPFGVLMGMDQWQLPEVVDVIGYDLYPRQRFRDDPAHISFVLDYAKSSTLEPRRVFWLNEIESGPIGGWTKGPEYTTRPRDIGYLMWEAVAHGSKLNLFQGWRDWDQIPLHWGALVDLDGVPVGRAARARDVAATFDRHRALLAGAHPAPAEVAILHTRENAIVLQGIDAQDFLLDAIRATYRAFWEAGFSVDFVSAREAAAGALSRYRVVAAPQMAVLGRALGEQLGAYVAAGGRLIGGPQLGRLSERGWFQHHVPGSGLRDVFGFEEREVVVEHELEVGVADTRWPGYWHRAVLADVADDVEVLAEFVGGEGAPAVVQRRHGEGAVLYFCTQADVAAARGISTLLPDMIAEFLRLQGIEPALRIEPSAADLELRGHILSGEGADVVIITNHRDGTGSYRVRVRTPRAVAGVDDLITGRPVEVQAEPGGGARWNDRWPDETEARAFVLRYS